MSSCTNVLSNNSGNLMKYMRVYNTYIYHDKTVNHFHYTLARFVTVSSEMRRGRGAGTPDIVVIRSQSSGWFTHGWILKALSPDTGESHSMNH